MKENKILITGPPRSGTTLMLMMFYSAGFDIGYSEQEVKTYYKEKSNGFEFMTDVLYNNLNITAENTPKVIKEPFRMSNFKYITAIDWALIYNMNIEHLIVCVRSDLEEVKKSTIRLLEHKKKLFPHRKKYNDPTLLDRKLEEVEKCSYLFLRQIVEYDLAPIFIEYPRFKIDLDYCHNKLQNVFNVSKKEFKTIWDGAIDDDRS